MHVIALEDPFGLTSINIPESSHLYENPAFAKLKQILDSNCLGIINQHNRHMKRSRRNELSFYQSLYRQLVEIIQTTDYLTQHQLIDKTYK